MFHDIENFRGYSLFEADLEECQLKSPFIEQVRIKEDPRRTLLNQVSHIIPPPVSSLWEDHKNLFISTQSDKKSTMFFPDLLEKETGIPEIEKCIEKSRYILTLGENWDEEGSPAISEETWNRATQFIRKSALSYKKESKTRIITPKISPGPDGSIDVRWKNEKRSILINFPADSSVATDFYGSDKNNDLIQGTLNLSLQNQWLLHWFNR